MPKTTRPPRGRDRSPTGETRVMVAFKCLPSELEEIDRRAKALSLSRTDYLIRAGLRQKLGDSGLDERVEALERRLVRVEKRLDLGFG